MAQETLNESWVLLRSGARHRAQGTRTKCVRPASRPFGRLPQAVRRGDGILNASQLLAVLVLQIEMRGLVSMERPKIGGIMQSDGRALVKIMSVPDHVSVAGTVLGALGERDIHIELLVESYDLDDCGNFSLIIDQKDLDHAVDVLEEIKPTIDAKVVSYTPDVAVITVFGPHLRENPRIHGLMFTAIASVGVSVLAIATSISSVSCVLEGQYLDTALHALQASFDTPFQVKQRPKDY